MSRGSGGTIEEEGESVDEWGKDLVYGRCLKNEETKLVPFN